MTARAIAAAIIFVIIALGLFWLVRASRDSVLISIERQNNVSGDKSDQARADYDRCTGGGGVFDFATGQCRRPAPRGRN